MIKSDRQYEYTKGKLREFEDDLKAIRGEYSSDKKKVEMLSQGYIEHIAQLKTEIAEYKKMKDSPLPKVLKIRDFAEVSRQIVRLRLARGFTQAKLASRIGCKQADVSRLEREDYQGYTLGQLKKIAASLDAKLELNLIPVLK